MSSTPTTVVNLPVCIAMPPRLPDGNIREKCGAVFRCKNKCAGIIKKDLEKLEKNISQKTLGLFGSLR